MDQQGWMIKMSWKKTILTLAAGALIGATGTYLAHDKIDPLVQQNLPSQTEEIQVGVIQPSQTEEIQVGVIQNKGHNWIQTSLSSGHREDHVTIGGPLFKINNGDTTLVDAHGAITYENVGLYAGAIYDDESHAIQRRDDNRVFLKKGDQVIVFRDPRENSNEIIIGKPGTNVYRWYDADDGTRRSVRIPVPDLSNRLEHEGL